jgi:hypothetical protein
VALADVVDQGVDRGADDVAVAEAAAQHAGVAAVGHVALDHEALAQPDLVPAHHLGLLADPLPTPRNDVLPDIPAVVRRHR